MKTFVSANELCHNLAISVQNGPALKEFLDLKGTEKRKQGKGIAYCREVALPFGQEFVKLLKEKAKNPDKVGVKKNVAPRKPKVDGMLLVIPLGRNETMTVTMQRAKEIFKELSVLFGD